MYVKETYKCYEKLEDAFKEYLKEHNCETCGKHCGMWLHIDRDIEQTVVCTRWQPKPCDHTYASVSVPGMELIVFECTKCGKEITYRKV